jgi:glycosyltransferase 2 family protein
LKKSLKKTIQISLFIFVGLLIFFLVYKDLDLNKIINALRYADYRWIAFSLVLGVFSHISRAVRWVLLIKPLGYKPKTINAFFSVMIMYLTNTAVPRSGEFVRCSVMTRYEKVPFSKLLGTVITERVFDFIMLFIFLALVFIYQIKEVETIIANNPGVYERFSNFFTGKTLIIIGSIFLVMLMSLYIFRNKLKKTLIWEKILGFIKNLAEGIKTVWYMKKKAWFIFHTVAIWVFYFLMIYVTFFAFDFTSELTLMQGLTIFVAASFGMVFPSPGGIGSWHFMVIQTLFIYGIHDLDQAGAFAFAAHGAMTLMLIVLGILSFIFMPLVNEKAIQKLVKNT